MNKKIIHILVITLIFTNIVSHAQIIESNTVIYKITNGKPKRGLPPILYAELSYKDDNNNGILEAGEKSILRIKIFNKGKGKAQRLKVKVEDNLGENNLIIKDDIEIFAIAPNSEQQIDIPIEANMKIKTATHRLKIIVTEYFGYDMDEAYLMLQTMSYREPKLVLAGYQIFDKGAGTAPIIADGQLQAGELVKIKVLIQNIGENIAQNIQFNLSIQDENIYIDKIPNQEYKFTEIKIGEVKELWYILSPNKRVASGKNLDIYLEAKNNLGKQNMYVQLPIQLGYTPPQAKILKVEPNLAALNNKAKFEYNSARFSIAKSNLIDVKMVEPAKTIRPNSVAVIIGIENYKNLPPAPYAKSDAELMKEYFKKKLGVEQVYLFKENEVSGYFFPNTFNPAAGELNKVIIPGETDLFVYYSGHGIPAKDGQKIYLMPYDGNISMLDVQGYNMQTFFNNLSQFGAKSVTVFLDACFSGSTKVTQSIAANNLTGTKAVGIKVKMPKPWENDTNYTVFTSSTGSQTSLGFDDSKNGLFTYYLMAGLQGNADANNDHKITMGELKDYVIKNVSSMSKRISGLQVPEFHGNEDMVLEEY